MDYDKIAKDILLKFVNDKVYKDYSYYKRFFQEPEEFEKSFLRSGIKPVLYIMPYAFDINWEQELYKMYASPLAYEALSIAIRGGEILDTDNSLINKIGEQPFSNMLVCPEMAAIFISEREFEYSPTDNYDFQFMGIELIGTYQGKNVFCNPCFPSESLVFFEDGFASYDVTLHSEPELITDWILYINLRVDKSKVVYYKVKDIEDYIFRKLALSSSKISYDSFKP